LFSSPAINKSSINRAIRSAYKPFKNQMAYKTFKTKFNNLKIDKWNFARASLLYQQALKCGKCSPEIAMVILCSSAESLKIAGRKSGPRPNFLSAYLTYCPQQFRTPPLKFFPNAKPPPITASFNQALNFIYARFRNLYVHQGKGRIGPKKIRGVKIFASLLLEKYKNQYYHLDTFKLHSWFELITYESLYSIL
jgi:hypothetical protein